MGTLGASGAPFWAPLGSPWAPFWFPWTPFGSPLASLGPLLGPPGFLLGSLGHLLGAPWTPLDPRTKKGPKKSVRWPPVCPRTPLFTIYYWGPKVLRAMQLIPPCGPLKNYHKGYLADPNLIRDTPLVPKGTVADIHMAASEKSLHQITYTSPVVTTLSWPVLTTLIMAPCAQRRFFSEAWSSLASWPGQHTIPLVA